MIVKLAVILNLYHWPNVNQELIVSEITITIVISSYIKLIANHNH